jgi:hypothetical protein
MKPRSNERGLNGVGVALAASAALFASFGCAAAGGDESTAEEELTAGASGRLVAMETAFVESGVLPALTADWQVQLGEVELDVSSSGVASDAKNNAVVAGYTLAPLAPEDETAARSDAYVAKYGKSGELLWTHALGTPESDGAAGVSCDAQGNVFVAGDTSGDLDGPARGFGDGFIAKLSADGELSWIRQLGTSAPDAATGVSADTRGNVFVAGYTRGALEGGSRESSDADVWVAKYRAATGDLLWARQLGSSPGYDDQPAGVSADGEGNVLVAGHSFGALAGESAGSADAFVAKLSADGELLWVQQRGSAEHDAAEAVATDGAGNVLIAGQRGGSLVGGPGVVLPGNPFVAKYSPEGELLWEQELVEGAHGAGTSVTSDAQGHVLLAGFTAGALGAPNRGLYDTFAAELSPEGELLWTLSLGQQQLDRATGLSLDASGALLLTQDVRGAGAHGVDQALLVRRARPAGN